MRKLFVLTAVLLLLGLVPGAAQANSARVTRGDARAIFEASNNGGWAVLLNGSLVDEGAPADFMPGSPARISPSALFNGRHYCVLDWHVINVIANEGNPVGGSRTIPEILEALDTVTVDIKLDGALMETMRTSNRRTTNPERIGAELAFSVAVGRIMAPDDLSAGIHSLQFTGSRLGRPPMVMAPISIHIDPAGTGACL